jgi:glutamyl-tRNA synthetase
LLKPTGQGKLSKRDGDKMGFPVFPLRFVAPTGEVSRGYREDGYFPEAFINMLALLGWNPGTEQEIFFMEELIEAFSLERVGKSGARFSPDKAHWFNAQYMHTRDNEELADIYIPQVEAKGHTISRENALAIVAQIKMRATFPEEFWGLSSFLFEAPAAYDEKAVKKYWKPAAPAIIGQLREILGGLGEWTTAEMEQKVGGWIAANEISMGLIMNAWRLCIVGEPKGFGMYDMCAVLGKEETLSRLDAALAALPKAE